MYFTARQWRLAGIEFIALIDWIDQRVESLSHASHSLTHDPLNISNRSSNCKIWICLDP